MEFLQYLIIFLVAILSYYLLFVVKKPRVVTSNRYLEKFLQDHVHIVSELYWPALFHWEGRLQSILGLKRRNCRKLPYTREVFTLSDGGEIGLDYLHPEDVGSQNTSETRNQLVLLLPGLTNSSQTGYVKTLALSIVSSGASLVVFNNRGLGGVELKTPRTYCASKCDDLREVLEYLKKKNGDEKLAVVGASLGGMMLCQYLTKYPKESKSIFSAALLISVVWDAISGIHNIEKPGLNWIINAGMAESLKGLAKRHQQKLEQRSCLNYSKILQAKTLRQFDTAFTAPLFGYENVWNYYKDCTITEKLQDFAIPVFSLNAFDDPMQPGKTLPLATAKTVDSNVAFIVTHRGGHLGFLEGFLPTRRNFHFSERFVASWLKAIAEYGDDLGSNLDTPY